MPRVRKWTIPVPKLPPVTTCVSLSLPFDLHDRQLDLSGRTSDADRIAFALAQERAPERRLVADPSGTQRLFQLISAHDLVRRLLAVLVVHGHRGPEKHPVGPGARGGIHHLVGLELLLQPVDLRVDLAQLPLAQLVLVVLAAISMRRGHRDLARDARTLLVEEPAELLAEPLESRPGNVLLHGFLLPEPCGTGNFAACRPRSPRASASR